MAYKGYLIKVGNYIIPHSMMSAKTYQVTKNGQDLDSYRDANGELHRTALEHFVAKVEFETPPLKTNNDFANLMGSIQRNYINATEKRVNAEVYIPETDSYMTQDMYVPDIKFEIYYADANVIKYNPVRIAFIGY